MAQSSLWILTLEEFLRYRVDLILMKVILIVYIRQRGSQVHRLNHLFTSSTVANLKSIKKALFFTRAGRVPK